ncbi:MAG: MerR family transcriptional regulator [Alistipes sp.]
MTEKLFYSMGEVADMFGVNSSLIRHWESQFSVLKPKRNKKGNRLFTPADVDNLKLIYHLVKEQGMTLEGAKKALRQRPNDSNLSHDMELLERLQRVRSLLEEVREELKTDEHELVITDSERTEEVAPRPRRQKAVVKITEGKDVVEEPQKVKKIRTPRRKSKEDAESKELFAFYEQSLF